METKPKLVTNAEEPHAHGDRRNGERAGNIHERYPLPIVSVNDVAFLLGQRLQAGVQGRPMEQREGLRNGVQLPLDVVLKALLDGLKWTRPSLVRVLATLGSNSSSDSE